MVWEGLRFVIVALPGLFSYLFFAEGIQKLHEDDIKRFLNKSKKSGYFFDLPSYRLQFYDFLVI